MKRTEKIFATTSWAMPTQNIGLGLYGSLCDGGLCLSS